MICYPQCQVALFYLAAHFKEDIYRRNRSYVHYDYLGRCVSEIHRDSYDLVYSKGVWDVDMARTLAMEVVDVLQPHLKLRGDACVSVKELKAEIVSAGLCAPGVTDAIFLQLHRVENPLQLITTTIHELAHLVCKDVGHHTIACDPHCAVWVKAAQMLTSAFSSSVAVDRASPTPRFLDCLGLYTGLERWWLWLPVSPTFCNDCATFQKESTRKRLDRQERRDHASDRNMKSPIKTCNITYRT